MAAGDGDVAAISLVAAAYACAGAAAGGLDLAAGDGDIARRDVLTAADARAGIPALRVDIAAIDIDMAAASLKASADSGRKPAASGVYRAGVEVQPLSGASMDGVSRVSRVSPAAGSYARAVLAAG